MISLFQTFRSRRFLVIGVAATLTIIASVLQRPLLQPSSHSTTRNLVEAMSSRPISDPDTPFADTFPERQLVVDAMELQTLLLENTFVDFNEKKFRRQLATNGFNLEYIDVEKPGATVMIVTANLRYFKTPIVVFRGSQDVDDWATNIKAEPVKAEFEGAPAGVKIHKGFHDGMFGGNVVNDIEERVLKILGKKFKSVIVTGYSLG